MNSIKARELAFEQGESYEADGLVLSVNGSRPPGPGPWLFDAEPDRAAWMEHGLQCLVLRHAHAGHYCGYVAVPKDHPAYGKNWMSEEIDFIQVHGGVTFGDFQEPGEIEEDKPVTEDLWWIGFDCAHLEDLSPTWAARLYTDQSGATYKDYSFVKDEVSHLASELAGMS